MHIQYGNDHSGFVRLPANPAGRLNVLAGRLGLTLNEHKSKPLNIEADRDHVGRQRHIDRLAAGLADSEVKPALCIRHFVCTHPAGEFHGLPHGSIGEWLIYRIKASAFSTITAKPCAHLVLDNTSRATEFTQGIEVADRRHKRVSRSRIAGVFALRRGQHRSKGAQEDEFRPLALSGEANIEARWTFACRLGQSEKWVAAVRTWRRKNLSSIAIK
jgi:hypothetical protein